MKFTPIFFTAIQACAIFSLSLQAETKSIRFSAIPAAKYDPDGGLGLGVIGNMYVDQKGYDPYRLSVAAKAIISTKGVHSHALGLDWLDAFSTKLRLISRVGLYSTVSQPFCGLGSFAKCDAERPGIEANKRLLSGEKKEEFERRYYKNRYVSFFGDLFARWPLWKKDTRFDLIGSYRGRYYFEGDFKHRGPYPGSYFEEVYKGKTDGYLSTLELGLMLDSRDNEPAPTSGYWLESTIRGGSSLWGSGWNYFGGNASARFYWPLDSERKFVVASQSIVDATVGDLPHDAMSRIGGSSAIDEHVAVGGQTIGRGIREQLFVGRFKAIEQLEFRYKFYSFDLWRQNFDLTAGVFGDFALTAWDYQKFADEMSKVHASFGGGLRVIWNKTFVVRIDVGVSPEENFAPYPYFVVGHVF